MKYEMERELEITKDQRLLYLLDVIKKYKLSRDDVIKRYSISDKELAQIKLTFGITF